MSEHRWFMSRDVPLAEAFSSYIDTVLHHRCAEPTVIDPPAGTFTLPISTQGGGDDADWRLTV